MKKLLLLLLLAPIFSFGQTFNDALRFLKLNEPEWACERFAEGTFKKRLEISKNENNSKLFFKIRDPSYSGMDDMYTFIEIDLSKVIMIESQNTSKECAGIRIITEPYGLAGRSETVKGRTVIESYNKHYLTNGWSSDEIRIKNDNSFKEKSERIIKAIKFMALQNGAQLEESHF